MDRTRALPLAALVLAACSCGSEPPKPNVLLITLDTTRADHLGCYGGSAETPNIDQLADEGALFARALSTAGLTPMSHASILTGLNNYRHGLRVFFSNEASNQLDPAVDTLPEILKRNGWQTAAFVSSYPVSEAYGLDQGFETFDAGIDVDALNLEGQQRHDKLWYEGEMISTQRRGDHTTSQALGWLEENGSAGPWCLWVHFFDAHDFSLVPDSEWIARFGIEYDKEAPLKDIDWRERMYDPEISFMDEQVGRLFDHLRATGQWEDTVIVLTADHGQGLKDGLRRHGWLKHRLLYDWSLHVPLIVRIPGENAGVRVEPLVRTIDVLPTLLQAVDLAVPEIEGESVVGLIRGEPGERRLAYADALNLIDKHSPKKGLRKEYVDNLFCLADERWKFIWHQHDESNVELYDLRDDPQELKNVAAEHPDVVAEYKKILEYTGAMRVDGTSVPLDTQALEDLGYIGSDPDDPEEDDHDDC